MDEEVTVEEPGVNEEVVVNEGVPREKDHVATVEPRVKAMVRRPAWLWEEREANDQEHYECERDPFHGDASVPRLLGP